ncbi:MAG TPA: type II toxin-antitoxin system VapC family toxin [Stellaceae bacterium]|nr:type II toxin-antitoxin system VapC family toxin [Stellaceae bacterium]
MKITADTNILLRAAIRDEPDQARSAARLLREAETIAVTLVALCEFAWVLRQGYRRTTREVHGMISQLIRSSSVAIDRPAVEAGLEMLEAGGDFADGVIAFEGRRLGGSVFASFDRAVIRLVAATGGETRLLGAGEE